MTDTIKAIETKYDGFVFRSRLEARWAVFFDRLGIKWVYEHEGYETPFGRYVPDFWLPNAYMRTDKVKGVYFEVKPNSYDDILHPSLEYVCRLLNVGGILAKEFPQGKERLGEHLWEIAPDWDNYMEIRKCPYGHVIFDFDQYTYDDCVVCREKVHSEKLVENAIEAASRNRFW